MRRVVPLLAILLGGAFLGPLAEHAAAACTLNPGSTFTVTNPTYGTVYVGTGSGSSGFCVATGYYLGSAFSCPWTPFSAQVGPYVISFPPVTIFINALAGVSQATFVCDKRAEVLP